MSGDSSRQYVVKLNDHADAGNDAVTYTLRGLQENELEAWTEFCASVFAYKANPPAASYFAHHYYSDPDRGSASWIRVAVVSANDGSNHSVIVASSRVFLRRVSLGKGSSSVKAGGIGEVCTAENHRRRGLSAQLLQDSATLLHAAGIQLSFLHSAPKFFPVYEKVGYICTTSEWSEVTIDCKVLGLEEQLKDREPVRSRHAYFPEDTEQLVSIHQSYSESRFVGCIIRSKEYWEQYISQELQGSLWVLEDDHNNQIIGWMSIRRRGDRYQLRDFGCKDMESAPAVFRQLLTDLLEKELFDTGPSFRLHMPTEILREVESSLHDSDYILGGLSDNDNGWMYKQITIEAISVPKLIMDRLHLIWPADSF